MRNIYILIILVLVLFTAEPRRRFRSGNRVNTGRISGVQKGLVSLVRAIKDGEVAS
jgi:hypothetical protein